MIEDVDLQLVSVHMHANTQAHMVLGIKAQKYTSKYLHFSEPNEIMCIPQPTKYVNLTKQ